MRIVHLSDLHLGKRISEFSLLEDQRYILARVLDAVSALEPQAVVIAGDIYDKAVPPAEAVSVFDDFLWELAARRLDVFVISGNHDSPERLAFGSRLLGQGGVHLAPVYDGAVKCVTLEDSFGPVRFYLLPFLRPAQVRRFFPEQEIESYTDALAAAIGAMDIDMSLRNVLVTHQLVTGARRSESEDISVGGLDNVDAGVFAPFDYVALGHVHRAQSIGPGDRIRYCGTPMKYAFSEAGQQKSLTVAALGAKGTLEVETCPLHPLRDMREKRGRYLDLTARADYAGSSREDYMHITLTDEEDIPDAAGKLRAIYPNLMRLDYDNARTRAGQSPLGAAAPERSPMDIFGEFYEKQNGTPLSACQTELAAALMRQIWEDGE